MEETGDDAAPALPLEPGCPDFVLDHGVLLLLLDLERLAVGVVPEHGDGAADDDGFGDEDGRRVGGVRLHPQVLVDLVVEDGLLQGLAEHEYIL